MLKPICVPCGLFFRPHKNGCVVEEGRPVGGEWLPYKLWVADAWRCEGCGYVMVTGSAWKPFAEHYQPDYEALKKAKPPLVRVNDC